MPNLTPAQQRVVNGMARGWDIDAMDRIVLVQGPHRVPVHRSTFFGLRDHRGMIEINPDKPGVIYRLTAAGREAAGGAK